MNGGEINGNTTTGDGGVVYVNSDASFTMTGGTLSGNTAASGGAIYVNSGKAYIKGGKITGNTATSNGGGIYFNSNTNKQYFKLTSPSQVYGNVSKLGSANDIYLRENADISSTPIMAVSEMELEAYDCWFDAYDGKEITGEITERQNRIY